MSSDIPERYITLVLDGQLTAANLHSGQRVGRERSSPSPSLPAQGGSDTKINKLGVVYT